ncbi:uncharacterized protein LOC117645328 [Thrips palmi]|uniref:Uncharacterized protein LOC117645328 n=1 Tax=Thrips palmi TaxID=161013 RepID=A0A6P8YVV1_THRPL|nr:uncharacterized protein LOC117645328 [Thrips palmi]
MTRKSVKFSAGLRRPWKTNLLRRETDKKTGPNPIFLSASCAERWSSLRDKFSFKSDSELVDYLLTLGEAQPQPSTSDQELDGGWGSSSRSGRKKRGPSLKAVLRRSSRKQVSKSDFNAELIESEEYHSDESCHSVTLSEENKKIIENDSRPSKYKEYSALLCKKRFDSQSEAVNQSNTHEDKVAKANQLNEELALLVETVALQPQKQNEIELYEFKDDSQSESGLVHRSSSAENSSNTQKVSHRRWKSYHKDKRKWKQSYAAILPKEEQHPEVKQKTAESSHHNTENERKIFKAFKKNRILTAYLDSQNKISDTCSKDTSSSKRDDGEVSSNEQEDKLDKVIAEPSSRKVVEDIVERGDSVKEKEDINDAQKEVVSSGKENQSKTSPSSEPVFIEVGERVKLKRRRRKLLQDSSDPSSTTSPVKEDDATSIGDWNTTDLERHHRKQRRNWKKSLINYDLDDNEMDSKNKKSVPDSPFSSSNITNEEGNNCKTTGVETVREPELTEEENLKKETCSGVSRTIPQECDSNENDLDVSQIKQCSQCYLRHSQQICPVLHPIHVVEDLITFEQWQLQCQVQVRCSVIEAPRPKLSRIKKSAPGSQDEDEKTKGPVSAKVINESTRSFAEESLPAVLELKVVDEEHGKSVVARTAIAQYTQFGPIVGSQIHEKEISDESDMRHIWEVLEDKTAIYLNTEDSQKSNWLKFMRPAPEKESRNITLVVRNKKLFFVSIVDISIGSELLYWADDHITSWSKKKILKSSCGGCNMRFAHPLYYRTHCAVFHDPLHSLTIRKYHCKICGEAVMGKENIMKHAADLHEGRGAYQCQYCHKFFLRLNYLEMHRTYGCSSNPHRTRPLCDFCGRYFCQPQKLKVHIKRMHSDMNEVLREFQCKSCLKLLGSRAALQRHFKEVHHRDVVVTSNCDRCGKSFQNRSNLKIHMLTHSGVKPFRCQQDGCSAAFTTKQCLQFHYKKAHGLSEDALPRIERSIAYTFDAYAGEGADGSGKPVKEDAKKPQRTLRKGRKSSAKSQKHCTTEVQPEHSENQLETSESPHKTAEQDSAECAEPLQVDHLMERTSFMSTVDPVPISDLSVSQKYIDHVPHGNPLSSADPLSHGSDERQSASGRVLTPLRNVTIQVHPHADEDYHGHHVASVMPSRSQSHSPQHEIGTSPSQDLQSISQFRLENKGHKKWLGEVIEVAEEAAAAAMRLSPRLSPHVKRDLYDFDDNKVKSKLQYMETSVRQDIQIDTGLGRSKTASALAPFHHPESASLLVEAALVAAERDICCTSLSTKSSPDGLTRSPEPILLPHNTYCVRSPQHEEPPNLTYYTPDPSSAPAYLMTHSSSSHPHLHQLDTYMGPPRLYSAHDSHQLHHLPLPQRPLSSDEDGGVDSDCNSRSECAQNLSLNMKDKSGSHPDSSTIYSAPSQHSELAVRPSIYQDHVSVPHQNDLSFSGAMVVSSPQYHLYDLSPDRQRSDISVTDLTVNNRSVSQEYNSYEDLGGSVDLSVPRSHAHDGHELTPSPPGYSTTLPHPYDSPHCVSTYSPHPTPYQSSPLQRSHVSSSSNSPNAPPSPGPAHYHTYPPYY